MSVGGRVIETIILPDRVWVNTKERQSRTECAIYVELTHEARCITEGDSLWWHGSHAFWTPRSLKSSAPFEDRKLRRIGCSGIARPTACR